MEPESKQIGNATDAVIESLPGCRPPTPGQAEFLRCSPERKTVIRRCLLAETFASLARELISTIAKEDSQTAGNLGRAKGFATAYFQQLALLAEEMKELKSYKDGDGPLKTMRVVAQWCDKVGFAIVPQWEDSFGARASAESVVDSLHSTMVSICGGDPIAAKGGRA